MQAVITGAEQSFGRAHHRRRKIAPHPRHETGKENDSPRGGCFHFLTTLFKPVATTSVTRPGWYGVTHEYVTHENFEYLRDSYLRYAQLMGEQPQEIEGDTLGERISNVHDAMKALVSTDFGVNIDRDEGLLRFTLWKDHDWSEWSLYWFPVKFIEKLNPRLRRIAVTFMHEFMHSNKMHTINDEPDTEMTLDWMEECRNECNDRDARTYDREIYSYREGKIYKALRRIERKSYYKNMPQALDRYEPANEYEGDLLELMKEGLQFIGADKPAIIDYSYDPDEQEEPDFRPLDLERQVRIVYDLNDMFYEILLDSFNCEQRETYCYEPRTVLELSPTTDALLAVNDYPERFYKWSDRFARHIM